MPDIAQDIAGAVETIRSAVHESASVDDLDSAAIVIGGRWRATMRLRELRALAGEGVMVLTPREVAMVRNLFEVMVCEPDDEGSLADCSGVSVEEVKAFSKRVGARTGA